MKELKIIFAGTPEFALPSMQALIASKHEILAVYTQPDRPAGRGLKLAMSPIKQLAVENKFIVEQPLSLRDPEVLKTLAAYQPDLIIVVAYGLILPEAVLNIPRYGCINVHASLLPRWRGAAPIARAILANDKETGITIMQMAKGLDTGDILLQNTCDIKSTDNTKDLQDLLAQMGAQGLLTYLDLLAQNRLVPKKQDEEYATYANKIEKNEARINWKQSAIEIDCHIRAFNPSPIAFSEYNGSTIRIWKAESIIIDHKEVPGKIVDLQSQGIDVACGIGILRIQQLQFPGGKVLTAKDVINSKRLEKGICFHES